MKRIDLYNRYGDKVYLEQEDNGDWFFRGDGSAFDHHRVIFEEDNKTIHAVDPSGGPYLAIGTLLSDGTFKQTITSFDFIRGKGYKVTLCNTENETDKT